MLLGCFGETQSTTQNTCKTGFGWVGDRILGKGGTGWWGREAKRSQVRLRCEHRATAQSSTSTRG